MGWLLLDLEPRYRESIEEQLVDTSTVLSSLLSTSSAQDLNLKILDRVFIDSAARRFNARIFRVEKNLMDLHVYVTDHNGKLLYDSTHSAPVGSDYSQWRDVALTLKGQYGARTSFLQEGKRESMILFVASPVVVQGELRGVLSVGKPLRGVSQFIYQARLQGALLGGFILLAVLGATYCSAKKISKPIRELIVYTQAVQSNRRVQVPVFDNQELQALATAVEEMRKKVEGRHYLQSMLEAFSHEMKSPVAAIRSAAEILSDGPPAADAQRFTSLIREQSSRITLLLQRLLELARLENRFVSEPQQRVDLIPIIRDIVENFDPLFRKKHVTLDVALEREYFVKADASQLATALENLLQNALDFTPAGGKVFISTSSNEQQIAISIKDTGTGIPDYALAKIFDRYYSLERPDTMQKSSGLGLSIVREIALLNRGTISVCNDASGGCRATLTLQAG